MEYEVEAAPHYPDKVHKISVTLHTGSYKHNHISRSECTHSLCFKMKKVPFASSQYYKMENLEGSFFSCMF